MQILQTARNNDYQQLKEILTLELDNINSTDEYDRTPLHIFVSNSKA